MSFNAFRYLKNGEKLSDIEQIQILSPAPNRRRLPFRNIEHSIYTSTSTTTKNKKLNF